MSVLANALPENTGDGYVAAAYVVFFVLLLVYLAIMALRLSHVQRDLQARTQESTPEPAGGRGGDANPQARTQESAREHDTRRDQTAATTTGGQQHQDDETREREPA